MAEPTTAGGAASLLGAAGGDGVALCAAEEPGAGVAGSQVAASRPSEEGVLGREAPRLQPLASGVMAGGRQKRNGPGGGSDEGGGPSGGGPSGGPPARLAPSLVVVDMELALSAASE